MGVGQQLVAALQSTNSPLEVGPLLISAAFSTTQYVDVALAETWCLVMYLRACSRMLSNWYFPSQNECMPQVKSQLSAAVWRELPGAYMCGWSGTIPSCLYVSLYCMFTSKRWCASSRLALQSCYTIGIALFGHFSIGYKSRWFISPLFSGTSYYWLVGCAPSKIACDLSDTEALTIHCAWATSTLPRLSRRYVEYIFHKWNSLLCANVGVLRATNAGVRRPGYKAKCVVHMAERELVLESKHLRQLLHEPCRIASQRRFGS